MFWIKFSLMVFLWILMIPLSLIISVICKVGKPPQLMSYYGIYSRAKPYKVSDWEESGDGPKFMGLGYFTTLREDTWRFLSSLVRDGVFHRTPTLRKDLPVFSGDQMAGFLLGLWRRWKQGLLTQEELTRFKVAFDKAYFEGVPLVMVDASDKWVIGRGWFWCPWEPCGGSTFAAATATRLLAEIYPQDYRYRFVAKILHVLSKVFIWSADFNFFFGRYYMLTMYAAHSLGCYAVLANAIQEGSGDYVIEQLHSRYPWNPDFEADATRAAALRYAAMVNYCKQNYTKEWFSIRSLKWKTMAPTAVAPSQRLGGNYVWEENPLCQKDNAGKTQPEFVWQSPTNKEGE